MTLTACRVTSLTSTPASGGVGKDWREAAHQSPYPVEQGPEGGLFFQMRVALAE